MRTWEKLVPAATVMDSNNCWHANNFNQLSAAQRRKMAGVKSFVHLRTLFNKKELGGMMNRILRSDDTSDLTPADYFLCLPNTFVIGFPHCGAALMHRNFEVHPDFAESSWREPHFWRELARHRDGKYRELDVLLYLFHFYEASQKIKERRKVFITDASTSTVYISAQPFEKEEDLCVVPMTMFNILPLANFIVIMRNPIDMMWSDFWFFCSKTSRFKTATGAVETFHEFAVTAINKFMECMAKQTLLYCATAASSSYGEESSCKRVRLGLGLYYVHLRRWFSVYPREQFLTIQYEDWLSNFSSTMDDVWSFIGVSPATESVQDEGSPDPWAKHFQQSDFKMLPETRKLLREFYLPYNKMLARLLNQQQYLLWNKA